MDKIKSLLIIVLIFLLADSLLGQEIFTAIRNNNVVRIKELATKEVNTRNSNNFTPLHFAVIAGQSEIVQILIDSGANVSARNSDGDTPLNLAASFGDKQITEILLDRNADFDGSGKKAVVLLQASARNGLERMVNHIIDKEGNRLFVDPVQNKWMIQDAVTGGSVSTLNKLISKGIPLDKGKDHYGWTLIHYAANEGKMEMLEYLFSVGFDINQRTNAGETAYNLAEKNKNEDIKNLIAKSGGIRDAIKFPTLKGKYLGQKTPGMKPEIFAPGIVSRPDLKEMSGTFSPDGKELYFYGYTNKTPSKIFVTKITKNHWTVPEEFPFTQEYRGSEPLIDQDNRKIFFMWVNPLSTASPAYWVSERVGNGWSKPTYAGPGMFMSQSLDGQMYTTDISSGNPMKIAKVYMEDNRFSRFERIEIPSVTGSTAHPTIAPDGSFIFFDSGGGDHIQLSFKKGDGSWGEPIDLTNHGFEPLAGLPTVSPDGKYLFFKQGCRGEYDVAHGNTNRDIWWVDIKVIERYRTLKIDSENEN